MDINHIVLNQDLYKHKLSLETLYSGLKKDTFDPEIFTSSMYKVISLNLKQILKDYNKSLYINKHIKLREESSILVHKSSDSSYIIHVPIDVNGGLEESSKMMVTCILNNENIFNHEKLIDTFIREMKSFCITHDVFISNFTIASERFKESIGIYYYRLSRFMHIHYDIEGVKEEYIKPKLDWLKNETEAIFIVLNSILLLKNKDSSNGSYIKRSMSRRQNNLPFEVVPATVRNTDIGIDFNYKLLIENGEQLLFHLSFKTTTYDKDKFFSQFEGYEIKETVDFSLNDIKVLMLDAVESS